MKNCLPIFILALFITGCKKDRALPPVAAEFQRTYGDAGDEVAYSIIETPDKNYLITGSTSSYGNGNQDVYILKTDQSGNVLWQKTFGGANYDIAFSTVETKDGDYLTAGVTKSFTSGVGLDLYLVKTDNTGSPVWQKTYGTINNDGANAITTLSDNSGYVLAGATGGGYFQFIGNNYLVKVNDQGDTLWTKLFGGYNFGDEAMSITAGLNGDFYTLSNTNDFGTSNKGLLVTKFNSAGDSLWSTVIDGSEQEKASKIKLTNDGGLVLCGLTSSYGDANGDLFAIKISPGGVISWQKNFGGMDYDKGNDVIQTRDGGFLFAGTSKSYGNGTTDMFLIKTDAFGIAQWMKTIDTGHYDEAYSLAETEDAYVIAGSTRTGTTLNDLDLFLVKIKKQ